MTSLAIKLSKLIGFRM